MYGNVKLLKRKALLIMWGAELQNLCKVSMIYV